MRKRCFLWLICTPSYAVQIWPVGQVQGHQVFSTSSVPDTTEAARLVQVRAPNTPVLAPALRAEPTPFRDIGVFYLQADSVPTILHVDDRVHGNLLFRWVCTALGLQYADWHFRRQVEALPSLPPEQYVLSAWTMPWHQVVLPVDLRPLGGRISLVEVHRNQPWGQIAAQVSCLPRSRL